jgi:transcriptional regulator with XRE-family HTH domain
MGRRDTLDERSDLISKLRTEFDTRAAYIQAKVGTLVPSQIRALRLKSEMPRQADLANAANMKQSRISMMETPGAANVTIGTLSSIAAALKVGLVVKFAPFSEMLAWENDFSQDQFDVVKIDNDLPFLNPAIAIQAQPAMRSIVFNIPSHFESYCAAAQRTLRSTGRIASMQDVTAEFTEANKPTIYEFAPTGARKQVTFNLDSFPVAPAPSRSSLEDIPPIWMTAPLRQAGSGLKQ